MLLCHWELLPPFQIFISELTGHEKICIGEIFFNVFCDQFKSYLNERKVYVSQSLFSLKKHQTVILL